MLPLSVFFFCVVHIFVYSSNLGTNFLFFLSRFLSIALMALVCQTCLVGFSSANALHNHGRRFGDGSCCFHFQRRRQHAAAVCSRCLTGLFVKVVLSGTSPKMQAQQRTRRTLFIGVVTSELGTGSTTSKQAPPELGHGASCCLGSPSSV